MNKPSRVDRQELRTIRRSISILIDIAKDDDGPLEYMGAREQVLDSAQHLNLCLDALLREAEVIARSSP